MKSYCIDLFAHALAGIVILAIMLPFYLKKVRKERKLMKEVQKAVSEDLEMINIVTKEFWDKFYQMINEESEPTISDEVHNGNNPK